ncbi:hypothetical protein E4U24_002479 [Claviceps purpurea]|nr:hypothetical protein E4U36_002132 [Claviceps purpurea]KAG6224127.1 hypothetical protein E4U26_003964 [Claviceps purpurea]KAG6258345.1 hypothetical protein E4U24_002479 [Claviceps purpurea]
MDQEDNPLLNIDLSDSSDQESDKAQKKADRTAQTEDEFQFVKGMYRARVENGNIHERLDLPLRPDTNKMRTQDVIHAVEELYFHRTFQQAIDLVDRALDGPDGAASVDNDSRQLLETYREKCQRRLNAPTQRG